MLFRLCAVAGGSRVVAMLSTAPVAWLYTVVGGPPVAATSMVLGLTAGNASRSS